ncbi:hepatocellular carcinoma-associated antigen 59-domain-containing protein [Dissophora ornata]|nr:hypothetical protein BGZ58_007171 [Dissophora ornata]KAI8606442.1 hepatocellular carcinoma-associated antigen 59-domain-containing protein [Dissophora ornata]
MSGNTKRRNYRKREVTPEETANESTGVAAAAEDSTTVVAQKTRDDEPEGLTLDELIELRKLRQRPAGIAAADLLVGDTTGKKKKKDKVVAADPWKLSSGGGLVDLDEVRRQEEGEGSKSTGILDSFTKQTNTLDVDKHMMKYIEEEMKKRRGEAAAAEENTDDQNRTYNGDTDILDELGIKRTAPKPEQEGNVQLSTTMLTAIPEVDLGMEARLKNIEETERAKRKLYEQRTTTAINPGRFSQPAYVPSDRERISHHQQNNRRNNSNHSNSHQHSDSGAGPNHRFQNTYGNNDGQNNRGGHGRGGMATDDLVMERFKKRMRR